MTLFMDQMTRSLKEGRELGRVLRCHQVVACPYHMETWEGQRRHIVEGVRAVASSKESEAKGGDDLLSRHGARQQHCRSGSAVAEAQDSIEWYSRLHKCKDQPLCVLTGGRASEHTTIGRASAPAFKVAMMTSKEAAH